MPAKKPEYVTIMLVPDGTAPQRTIRMRYWLLKLITGAAAAFVIVVFLFIIFYGEVLKQAARADTLAEENERLRLYRHKVRLLEHNLNQTRDMVRRLTELAGIDYEFPQIPSDSTLLAQYSEDGGASVSRPFGAGFGVPTGMPIQGFISQDYEVDDSDHYHPGIDIACGVGTPVLATAAGKVVSASWDSVYGHLLVINHNDSIQTVYGHNDTLLVDVDQQIMAGSRVALSGNTGVSTAPHLHYEVRVNGKPIDPLKTLRYEEE
jgi:murein DD-endopeptidase MepM/ murein hydrolase activator NlpD